MSEWIEWNGGECPVPPNVAVDVKFRRGKTEVDDAGLFYWGCDIRDPIVAYRSLVAKPAVGTEPASPQKALDRQEGGDHYKGCAIQPVEFIHANGLGFFEGNVVKYVTRWRKKNGLADLRKAVHYLELLIELEEAK